MLNNGATKVSPAQLASEWGISLGQVLRLIHGNQLAAINVALRTCGRPRYLIDRAEVERFERSRRVGPIKSTAPRQRRQAEDGYEVRYK